MRAPLALPQASSPQTALVLLLVVCTGCLVTMPVAGASGSGGPFLCDPSKRHCDLGGGDTAPNRLSVLTPVPAQAVGTPAVPVASFIFQYDGNSDGDFDDSMLSVVDGVSIGETTAVEAVPAQHLASGGTLTVTYEQSEGALPEVDLRACSKKQVGLSIRLSAVTPGSRVLIRFAPATEPATVTELVIDTTHVLANSDEPEKQAVRTGLCL